MKKSTYILIYGLIASSFFDIIPFGYLNSIARGAAFTVLELLWFAFGIYIYPSRSRQTGLHSKFLLLFYLSVIPSFFMARQLFGQTLFQSLITSRSLLLYLAIPTFFKIAPTPKEVVKGCYVYSIIFIVVCLARTLIPIQFYIAGEKQIGYMAASGDFLNRPIELCFGMIVLPLLYYCQELYESFNMKTLKKVIIIFLIIIAIQNRSILFPSALIVALTFIFSKWKSKSLKFGFICIIVIISITILATMFSSLINETTSQLSSTGDPRVIAMAYFLNFERMSWAEILFGTGNISFQTSSFVEDLQLAHIHYSDVGMVGFWSIYGLFAVAVLLWYIIKSISNKSPLYIKAFGIMTIVCSLTWCYFNSGCRITWFVLLLYLFEYYRTLYERKIIIPFSHKQLSNKSPITPHIS